MLRMLAVMVSHDGPDRSKMQASLVGRRASQARARDDDISAPAEPRM